MRKFAIAFQFRGRPLRKAAIYRQARLKVEITFCVRGVISPLLANLFLHYAFDRWMSANFPSVQFERYADDAIVHLQNRQASPDDAEGNCQAVAGLGVGTPTGEDADHLLQG